MVEDKWFEKDLGKMLEGLHMTEITEIITFCIDEIIEDYDCYINSIMDKDDDEDRKIQEDLKNNWIEVKKTIENLQFM